ncbi:MAG: hypothetical protein P1V51_07980 [Deltaproteobacteria bacterium]|nr:hypothetical protein [Deltaproteobacteria bacterium]
MRRWLRLLVYLGVACLALGLALLRLIPWARVLVGPISEREGLASPWPWLVIALVALGGLGWLVADLGLGLRRMPAVVSALSVGAMALAVLLSLAEAGAGVRPWSRISDAPAKVQAVKALGLLGGALGDHHREAGRFPEDPAVLAEALREEDGQPILSAYLHAAARRQPLRVEVREGAGPLTRVPEGILPGTLLAVFSPGREAYWLTAVVGEGVPARAEILAGEEGSPVIVSNVPRGWAPP